MLKFKNINILKNELNINLNCSQFLTLNVILGHNIKIDGLKKHFAQYYFFVYNNNIFFNFI